MKDGNWEGKEGRKAAVIAGVGWPMRSKGSVTSTRRRFELRETRETRARARSLAGRAVDEKSLGR